MVQVVMALEMDEDDVLAPNASEVLRRLANLADNKACFDCGSRNPDFTSPAFGVFICRECARMHRHIGVKQDFSVLPLKSSLWTTENLQRMMHGGNKNARPHLKENSFHQIRKAGPSVDKYTGQCATKYRENLTEIIREIEGIPGWVQQVSSKVETATEEGFRRPYGMDDEMLTGFSAQMLMGHNNPLTMLANFTEFAKRTLLGGPKLLTEYEDMAVE